MGHPVTYQGFWGKQSSSVLFDIANFLSWERKDWIEFEKLLDRLEKKSVRGKKRSGRLSLRQTLYSLRRQGILEQKKQGNRVVLRLTDKAWSAFRIARLRQIIKACPSGLCYVVYDIPETRRHARDAFRYFLKKCGFHLLQRSIWSSPRDVGALVCDIIRELEIGDWVTVIEGHERKN